MNINKHLNIYVNISIHTISVLILILTLTLLYHLRILKSMSILGPRSCHPNHQLLSENEFSCVSFSAFQWGQVNQHSNLVWQSVWLFVYHEPSTLSSKQEQANKPWRWWRLHSSMPISSDQLWTTQKAPKCDKPGALKILIRVI